MGLVALLLGVGCGGATPHAAATQGGNDTSSSSARAAAAPCVLSGGVGAEDTSPAVFMELAGAEGELAAALRNDPPLPSDVAPTAFEAFVGDPRLKQVRVYHLLGPSDVPQTVQWGEAAGDGKQEPFDITIVPHVDGPAPAGVRMQVTMLGGAAVTTVVVSDQQSVVLAPAVPGHQALFILTPYVLWNEGDVGRLLACKRRRASHAGLAGSPELP